ncbi:MAG: hypothetical protein PUP92_01495 [Rhizonema sp. PD38]|nr:hypothetical protein [Rhizonema sp. PD38]
MADSRVEVFTVFGRSQPRMGAASRNVGVVGSRTHPKKQTPL